MRYFLGLNQDITMDVLQGGFPYGTFRVKPDWDFTTDGEILPGQPVTLVGNETIALANGDAIGLSFSFVTQKVNEALDDFSRPVAVQMGQFIARIYAPAYDTSASWAVATDGSLTPLIAKNGKLTPKTASDTNYPTVAYLLAKEANSILVYFTGVNK